MTIRTFPGADCPLGWGLFESDDEQTISVVQRDDAVGAFASDQEASQAAGPVLLAIARSASITAAQYGAKDPSQCSKCWDLGFVLWQGHDDILTVRFCNCVNNNYERQAETKQFADKLFSGGMETLAYHG